MIIKSTGTMLAIGALFLMGMSAVPARADFMGQSVELQYLYPSSSSVYENDGTEIVTPGGVTFTSFEEIQTLVTGSELAVTNVGNGDTSFDSGDGVTFNGIELSEVGLSPDTITGVAIDPSNTVAGFDLTRVTFDGTDVFLNFQGLPLSTTDQMAVDVTFADSSSSSAPEPATILLAGAGLAAAAFGRRLRSRKSAA